MNNYTPSFVERLLRRLGHSGVPGAFRFINKFAPRHGRNTFVKTNLFELNYRADVSDYIDRMIYYFGSYSIDELYFLRDTSMLIRDKRNRVNFFDIGANCGQHSLFVSNFASQVHSFEPSKAVSERFTNNITLNLIDNITLHQVALGEDDAEIGLGSGFSGNSGSRSLLWSLPGEALEPVQVRNAEAYFQERNLPPIDLLKLDCEGFEKTVLRSLKERLDRDRPVVMMEFIKGGGYAGPDELRRSLYPDHVLKSLVPRRGGYGLREFNWEIETLVVAPLELAPWLKSIGGD